MPTDDIVWDSAPVPIPSKRDAILNAVRHVESRGNPNAVSPAGAIGPYQFMPATAKAMGVANPRDEAQARAGADKYLTQLEGKYGDTNLALLAYNWGPGNVDAWLKTGKGIKGQSMPVEAQQYVGKVQSTLGKQPAAAPAPADDIVWDEPAPKQPSGYAGENPGVVKQFLGGAKHAWDTAAANLQSMAGAVGMPTGESLQPLVEQGKQFVEETGPASSVGNLAGEIAMTAAPGTLAFKAARAAPILRSVTSVPGRVLRAAIAGGAAGGASEAAMGRDPLTGAEIGTVLGVAVPGAARLGNELLKQGQRFAGGASGRAVETLQNVFGDRTAAAIAALRGTAPIVPGERVTAGMAASPTLPELAVLERGARSRPLAHEFTQADAQTAAARAQALENVAAPGRSMGTNPVTGEALRSPYEEIRHVATNPLYETAKRDLVAISPELESVLRGPELAGPLGAGMREFNQAVRNARAAGLPLPQRGQAGPAGQFGSLSIDQLQRIVKNLDPTNFNHRLARREITEVMRNASPSFNRAQTDFAALSQPQNQADVAALLRDKLVSPTGSGAERFAAFTQALRDLPATFHKADLSPRYGTMEQVFNTAPQDLQAIRQVERSIGRQAAVEAMPTTRGIVPEYLSPFDKAALNTPHMLSQPVTVLRSVMKTLGRQTDEQVQQVIDRAMTSPAAMADLLAAVPPTERNRVLNAIRQYADTVHASTVGPTSSVLAREEQ